MAHFYRLTKIPEIHISEKTLVLGYSGSGKTTLMQNILYNYKNKIPIICIDTIGGIFGSKPPRYDYQGEVETYNEFKPALTYHFLQGGLGEKKFEELFLKIIRFGKPLYVIVDEVDAYMSVYKMPRWFNVWAQQSRNYDSGGIFSARRIGAINKHFFGAVQKVVLFKLSLENDLAYLSSSTGVDFFREAYTLKEHQYKILDLRTSTWTEPRVMM